MKRTALYILILALSFDAVGGSFEPRELPPEERSQTSVLFLGNSYTHRNDLPQILTALGKAADPPVDFLTDHHTPGGATLEHHWKEGHAAGKMTARKWDWIVLQEQSMRPVRDFPNMAKFAALLATIAHENGAQLAFFMTWARADKPEMTETLVHAYRALADQHHATLVPVGLAWRIALEERPDILLHEPDRSHPNARGSYLASCVFYTALTGRSPVGLSSAGLEIAPQEAAFLQDVALRASTGLNKRLEATPRSGAPQP